ALREFFIRVQRVLQKHEVTSSLYSHAASGQIHMRPFMTTPKAVDAAKLSALASDFNEIALSLGGTISGEHGDGLSRSCFVGQQYGPLYSVFRQVKDIFDPHNLMNPGKIITEQKTIPASRMRPVLTDFHDDLVQLQLNWKPEELAQAAENCDGCAMCRTQQDELRMCPFFRLEASEEASPRAKANLMRSLLAGEIHPTMLQSSEYQHL
ncbi:MAG: oxidase, partial [Planctomycetaceae bacterium]|nr:oxidase [Planctomycetaceae bacterium]